MRKLSYNIEKDLIRVLFDGNIKSESITRLITDIAGLKDTLPSQLKVHIDSRRAKFEIKPNELNSILKKLKEHHGEFETIKLSIVLQSPYETAISIIMKEMLRGIGNVFFEVFSTEKAALLWLK